MAPYIIEYCVSSILFVGMSVYLYTKNKHSSSQKIFGLFNLSVAIWQFGFFRVFLAPSEHAALFWVRFIWTGVILIPTFFYHFTVVFFDKRDSRVRTLVKVSYILSAIFIIALWSTTSFIGGAYHYFWGYYGKAGFLQYLFMGFFTVSFGSALFIWYKGYKEMEHTSFLEYSRRKYVFLMASVGLIGAVDFLPNYGVEIYPFAAIPITMAFAFASYAIIKHQLMDIQTVVHKTIMWAAMSSLVLLPVGGLFYVAHPWIQKLSPFQLALVVGMVGLSLIPYVKAIQPQIDHLFQRRKHDLQKILQDFIHEISVLKGLDELVTKLQSTITSVLYPQNTSIVLFDVKKENFNPFLISNLAQSFSAEQHIKFLRWLENRNRILDLDLIEHDPQYSEMKERAKKYFNDTHGKLVVPVIYDRKLLGVINLGQKENLKPYNDLDINFLASLRAEASIAFSNAVLYDDVNKMSLELKQGAMELERKVEERTKELADSKQEVEMAYAKLKELDAIKTKFFANVSHEFRTPLTLIMAPIESLLKGEMGALQKSQEDHVKIMYQNSLRLLKMINNLLDLAKIDSGKMQLTLDRVNLPEFIKGITASVSPMAEKKKIRLSFVNKNPLPEIVCDKEKVERVLLNLIFNALKFTEPGGSVMVLCGTGRPEDGNGEGESVLVSVTDTGIGFPMEYRTQIFERFSQVDASASRKHEGSGIGLSLAKELVELHGGRIWAQSEPGQGTEMTFTLPMDLELPQSEGTAEERRAARRRERDRRAGERRREEDWTRALHTAAEYSASDVMNEVMTVQTLESDPSNPPEHTILLIEDNSDMRAFIAFQLQGEFGLIQARDGNEGVELAKQHRPSLIISDVMMPGMDGYQVCRKIKSDPHTQHIPVILLTAKADLSEKISGLELGADDYLTKPFNGQELKAKIRSLIRLRRLEREIQHRSEELEQTVKRLGETQSQLVHSEKMAALGLLVAGVAHEVNNPVSFAKGSLSNLRRYLLQVRQALEKQPETREVLTQFNNLLQDIDQSLSIVKAGLDRTEGIVTDLKAFARKDEQNFKRVDIHEGLEATIKLIRHELADRITLHREYDLRGVVDIIPGQINQVFMNLLQNAIHAIPGEGEIWLRSWEDGDRIHVAVRDNGGGIKKEHLGRVFEPFFTTKEVGRGTGLGLSVSYRIIENHRGKITVSSEEGKGTEFVFTLPKRQTPESDGLPPVETVAVKGNPR